MTVFESICLLLFLLFIFSMAFGIVFWSIAFPYCSYKIRNKNNKIEWKCVEDWDSQDNFRNGKSDTHICDLYYRVIPSELNKFVNIIGDNDWHRYFYSVEIKTKEDFLRNINGFNTMDDIYKYTDSRKNVLFRYP